MLEIKLNIYNKLKEYSLIAIFSFILGLLIYHFLFNKSEPVNFDGLSKDIHHLLEIQRKDWEKGQIDLKGVVFCKAKKCMNSLYKNESSSLPGYCQDCG